MTHLSHRPLAPGFVRWLLGVALLVGCDPVSTSSADAGAADALAAGDAADAAADNTQPDDTAQPDTAESDAQSADAVDEALPPTLTAAITSAVETLLVDEFTHGLTVTIDVPDLGRWSRGIGFRDAAHTDPMQGSDLLRVGSITKTFVTAAILHDVEAGTLSLDTSLATLLPELNLDPAITLELVLSHRSGLFNYSDDGKVLTQTATPIAPLDLYQLAVSHPPKFAPGTDYDYSNTNFIVLGILLEKLHGVPLHQLLRKQLLGPNGLQHIWLEGSEDIGLQRVAGYLGGQPALAYDPSWSWAAGAMVANGADLCSWLRALYVDGAVLDDTTVERMVVPSPASQAAKDSYGLGTMIDVRGGKWAVGHTGSTMGFNGEVYIERESGICVALLTNDFFGIRGTIARKVWDVLVAGL